MAVLLTPISGYTGKINITTDDIYIKDWTLNSEGGSIDVTAAGVSSGYAMYTRGLVGYSLDCNFDIDVGDTATQSMVPGTGITTITLYKDSDTAFCTFTNDTEATSTYAGIVESIDITCSVEGTLSASLKIKLNGTATFA